jgi:hypothetical protein
MVAVYDDLIFCCKCCGCLIRSTIEVVGGLQLGTIDSSSVDIKVGDVE